MHEVVGAGPVEGAHGAKNRRYARQSSDEDEIPENLEEEPKDASASAPIEAAEPQGDEYGEVQVAKAGFSLALAKTAAP